MSLLGQLAALALRQAFDGAADHLARRVQDCFTDHSQVLTNALNRANDRAWQAFGLALGGAGLLDHLQLWTNADLKAVRDQLVRFVEQTPTGLEATPADVRRICLDEFRRLRKAGRLNLGTLSGQELGRQVAGLRRFSDPAGLADEAHRAVTTAADALANEAAHLAALLRHRPVAGQPPLLAAAFAFFFRRELE